MRNIKWMMSLSLVLGLLGCTEGPGTIISEYCDNQTQYCDFDGTSSFVFCQDFQRDELLRIDELDANDESDCADAILDFFDCGRTLDECASDSDACDDVRDEMNALC